MSGSIVFNRMNQEKKSGVLNEKSGVHILRKVSKYLEKVHRKHMGNIFRNFGQY